MKDHDSLRAEAEAQLLSAREVDFPARSPEELLHEFQVHQIELEMQNESLRQSLIDLEESRDRYVDFYDFAPVGYLTLSRDGFISEINLTGAALLEQERHKLLSLRFASFVAPEDCDLWNLHFMAVLRRDSKLTCELKIRRRDGSHLHVQIDSLRLLKDGMPSVVRIALTDIAERKQLEEKLGESEKKFHSIFESANDCIELISMDGRIVDMNHVGHEMLGYTKAEMLGKRLAEFGAPDYATRVPERMALIKKQGSVTFESARLRKDGTIIPLEVSSRVVELGGQPIFLSISRDISKRKQDELALYESEVRQREQKEFLAAILENALDAIVVMDSNGVITGWNVHAEKIFGWHREEAVGRLMHETIVPVRFREAHVRGMGHFLSTGEGPVFNTRIEIFALHRDGREFPVELSISPSKTADGYMYSSFIRDISERKNREWKFALLSFALSHVKEAVYLLDEQARFIYVNDEICRSLGYSREELLGGMHVMDINPSWTNKKWAVHWEDIKSQKFSTFESRHRTRDGYLFPVEINANYFEYEGCAYKMALVRDITERLLMETALHESETHLRKLEQREIVQTSLDGFWVVDTETAQIIEVNDVFCRMVGYSREELLSMRIYDLEAEESAAETVAHMQKIKAVGYDRFETHHRHKQGRLINLEASVSYSELDGGIFFVFVRDITERKRAENILLESENKFRTFFESATDCLLILDMDGRIIDINITGYERLGYEKQEMLGRRIAEFDTPECAALVPERMTRINADGKATFEAAHVCKDGTIMPVEINSRIIRLDGEQRYFSVIRDITERKRMEGALRDLTAHLQSVREEEKLHLSREIHDHLGSTLAALKIETTRLGSGLSAEQKGMPQFAGIESMVELLDEATVSMRHIISDLRPTMLDDLGLMKTFIGYADEFQKRTGIACPVACSLNNAHCKLDCREKLNANISINLFRIFQETLTNVARHSGASKVEVEFRPGKDEIILSIRDNGRGLPEGHTIASTSFGIRGMCERVEHMGGRIEFNTPHGDGLHVTVMLPNNSIMVCAEMEG